MACISGVLCLGAIALSGCQSKNDDAAAAAVDAAPAEASASDDYPLLQTVPPRPQLSYTVEQQREIVEALIADRENARYTNQVVRYRSGLSSLPPPPPTPVAPAAGEASDVDQSEASEPGATASTEPGVLEEDTFAGFLRALGRRFQSDAPEPTPEPTAPDDISAAPAAPQNEPAHTALAFPQPAQPTTIEAPPDATPPLPPTETAVAARQEAIPETPAPLPPTQTAVAARRVAADQTATDPAHTAPIPKPHPERAALAGSGPVRPPEPPPVKPQIDRQASLEADGSIPSRAEKATL